MAISRRRVAVAVLVLLGWAAAAHAEDAARPPQAPPGTRTLADPPFQLVLPRGHAFGDWAGSRTWLEEHGVTVTFLPLLKALGLAGAYALYALAAVFSLPFVWRLVRETRGKTLEQM